MYVGIWAVLATGVGIFAIAILFLQKARRYVDLTEKRLELLREGEAFLLKIVQRQGCALEESPEREAQQRERAPGDGRVRHRTAAGRRVLRPPAA